jgi:hypothetical protein
MALNITLVLTANDSPSPSNIIPGGPVTGAGATHTAAVASLQGQLESRKASFQAQAQTVQNVQDALNS